LTATAKNAKRLARSLLILNQDLGMSWREIAHHAYGDKVHFATLNRIAKSKGSWLPKDCEILTALGLKKPRKPRSQTLETIIAMSQMVRQGLRLWKKRRK